MFEETRDGDQGKFAETLRDQHLYDVMSTYPAIEDAIRRAVHVEKGGADAVLAAGKRFNAATDDAVAVETTVAVIRKGLAAYDRGIPESMLNKVLATGLALPLADAPFSDYRTVQVEDFVQRLRTIVIARFSKAKAETEAQIEEKFMRSLPEEEKKVTLCPPILAHNRSGASVPARALRVALTSWCPQAIERCFNEMDADFSGTLNQEELAETLRRTYGMNPSPDELSQLIAVCDKSGDGPPTHAHTAAAPTFALCRRCSTRLRRADCAGRVHAGDGHVRGAQDGGRHVSAKRSAPLPRSSDPASPRAPASSGGRRSTVSTPTAAGSSTATS